MRDPFTREQRDRPLDEIQHVPDAELISAWQLFRTTMGLVDARLGSALIDGANQPSVYLEILAELARTPAHMLPMSALASAIGMSSGGLTKLIDRLVEDGLVTREHSRADRRVVYAVLTDAGVEREQRTTPAYAERLRSDFEQLGPGGLDAIREVCRQIRTNFAPGSPDRPANPTEIHGGRRA